MKRTNLLISFGANEDVVTVKDGRSSLELSLADLEFLTDLYLVLRNRQEDDFQQEQTAEVAVAQ